MWNDIISFNPGPPANMVKLYIIFGFVGLLFLLFLLSPTIRKKTSNKALKKIIARSRVGLLGFPLGILFLTWMRIGTVPVLSARIWFILLLFVFFIWAVVKCISYRKIRKRILRAQARRLRK